MELVIKAPTEDGFIKAIEFNHEEIKEELLDKVAMYSNMVYDDNQISEAKKDRAELNKFKKALEDKRKEVKAKCLAPYEDFEKKMKELVAIVDKPVQVIDSQVKAFEEEQRQNKLDQIMRLYENKDFHGFTFEEIADPKWLNASASMKSIEDAMDTIAGEIAADIGFIEDLTEYKFEALTKYKESRDLRAALDEVKRQKSLAEQKAAYEKQQQEELMKQTEEVIQEINEILEDEEDSKQIGEFLAAGIEEGIIEEDFIPDFEIIENTRFWMPIKAYMNPDDVEALKEFFANRSIEFEILGGQQ